MTDGRHIPALDGLRGFAALIVAISHFPDVGLPRLIHHRVGDYGVMLFFVLSGFLMGHLYLARRPDRQAILHYGAARIARILPLYLGTALLSCTLFTLVDPAFIYPIDGRALLRLLTFTSPLPIFWSIGPEFQFYFLFPLIWLSFHVRRQNRRIAFFALATAICLIFAISPWTPGFSALSKLHIFVAGIGTALIAGRAPLRHSWRMPVLLAAFAFLGLLLFTPRSIEPLLFPSTRNDPKHIAYYGDAVKILLCVLVLYSATFSHRLNRWIWSNAPMRTLGAWSFSLYLLHMPALYLAARMPLPVWAKTALAVGFALTLAALSNRFFEMPANHMVRQRLGRLIQRRQSVGALVQL
jgi:peptidoglycan/LPS O-acetylase OafA/YrhL